MLRHVLSVREPLDVLGIYTASIQAGVMDFPTITPIRRRKVGFWSSSMPVNVYWRLATASCSERRISSLRGMAALPHVAICLEINNYLAGDAFFQRRELAFSWH